MGDWEGLNADFATRLRALQQVCPNVDVGSGFRTREEQARLYAEKPNLAAPPGKSNHEGGLAADLTGDLACVRANAPQFGLVQPMAHEPWHWEPAGVTASASADSYTQPADGVTGPPADPVANAVASFMDQVLGGGQGLPIPGQLATDTTQPADQPAGTAAPAVSGGDWQASLTPAERWILERESSLNPTAQNPTSTAFGIWQGLESTRKQYLGENWQTTDPVLQLDAFRRYVKDRYGTAEAAQAHHEAEGWY